MPPLLQPLRIQPIVLAGGVGARLAPISSEARPKPFVPLADGESLLTKTLARLTNNPLFLPPILIGRVADRFALLNHARAAGVVPRAILLEPKVKNTAMAVALGVGYAEREKLQGILAFLPADHWVEPVSSWQEAIVRAAQAAGMAQKLCLLSIPPRAADGNYGYMQLKQAKTGEDWQEIERFIEKPADPAAILAQSRWNSGQFIAPLTVFAQVLHDFAPDYALAARRAMEECVAEREFLLPSAEAYLGVTATPFDRAVVEKAPAIAMPHAAEWQDMGSIADWEKMTGLTAAHYQALPERVDRPWGFFELVGMAPDRVEKILTLYPGCRISRQRHAHRDEHWEIHEGEALVEIDDVVHTVKKGNGIHIPARAWHRLSNNTKNIVIIKEIQTGNPDESDIIRSDDDYDRI